MDGTFIDLEQDENAYKKTVGADGEVSRSRSNNQTGTLKLTLKQTSPGNDVLSSLYDLDLVSNAGIFPVTIEEGGGGRTLMFAQAAWIEKLAKLDYGKDIVGREWVIALSDIKAFIGGNDASSGVA
jgi:hypothetical protein